MRRLTAAVLLAAALAPAQAETFVFAGRTWTVRDAPSAAPGPNAWSQDDARVDPLRPCTCASAAAPTASGAAPRSSAAQRSAWARSGSRSSPRSARSIATSSSACSSTPIPRPGRTTRTRSTSSSRAGASRRATPVIGPPPRSRRRCCPPLRLRRACGEPVLDASPPPHAHVDPRPDARRPPGRRRTAARLVDVRAEGPEGARRAGGAAGVPQPVAVPWRGAGRRRGGRGDRPGLPLRARGLGDAARFAG